MGGWVKTGREAGAGAFAFLEINDGSCFESIQVGVMFDGAAENVSMPIYWLVMAQPHGEHPSMSTTCLCPQVCICQVEL